MDSEDRVGMLVLGMTLLSVIVLPLLILEAPWLLALAMLLLAGYWWRTGRNPASATLEAVRGERDTTVQEPRTGASDDPLSVLRERYARGEITDEEFERRLDRLLETEPDELNRERERGRDRAYER